MSGFTRMARLDSPDCAPCTVRPGIVRGKAHTMRAMNSSVEYRFDGLAIPAAEIDRARNALDRALAAWSWRWTPAGSLEETLERHGFLTVREHGGDLQLVAYVWPSPHLEGLVLDSLAPHLSPGGRVTRRDEAGQHTTYLCDGGRMRRTCETGNAREQVQVRLAS